MLAVYWRDRTGVAGRLGVCAAVLAMLCGSAVARAPTPAQQAIRGALTGWAADFNADRADRVCDLFAADLRYDDRGRFLAYTAP